MKYLSFILIILPLYSFIQSHTIKSMCPSCPQGIAANFCTAQIGNLCVQKNALFQGDISVCGVINGATIPTILDQELAFTTNEFYFFDRVRAPNTPACFSVFPNQSLQMCGWQLYPPIEKQLPVLEILFGIPKNIDLNIPPVIDLHFFTTLPDDRAKEGFIRFGIGCSCLKNREQSGDDASYQTFTANIPVDYPDTQKQVKHFMISVPLADPLMSPQSMASLYIARIGVEKPDNEFLDSIYLACVNFRYRSLPAH